MARSTFRISAFAATMLACALLVLAGFATAFIGHAIPVFRVDDATRRAAFDAMCTPSGVFVQAAYERYTAMLGNHYALIDAGVGTMLAAGTVAVIAFVLRLNSDVDCGEPWLRTPRQRWIFFVAGLGLLAWAYCAICSSFEVEQRRDYFPFCDDPFLMATFAVTMITAMVVPSCLVTGGTMALMFGQLPVSLGQWDRARPIRSWSISIVFGLLFVLVAAAMMLDLKNTTSATAPASIVALYLIASTRAALLAPRMAPD